MLRFIHECFMKHIHLFWCYYILICLWNSMWKNLYFRGLKLNRKLQMHKYIMTKFHVKFHGKNNELKTFFRKNFPRNSWWNFKVHSWNFLDPELRKLSDGTVCSGLLSSYISLILWLIQVKSDVVKVGSIKNVVLNYIRCLFF